MKRIFSLLLILMTFSVSAFAQEVFELNRPIRANGMGGVILPFPSVYEALYVNPAFLTEASGIHIEIANIGMGINGTDFVNNANSLSKIKQVSDLNTVMGKKFTLMTNDRMTVVLPHFAFGAFDDGAASFVVSNPAMPTIDISFRNDWGYYLGGAIGLSDILSFGVAGKRIARWGGTTQSISLGSVSGNVMNILNNFDNKGVGYGIDAGVLAKFPGTFSPRVSMVWQDVGDTQFLADNVNQVSPPRIKQNVSLGVGTLLDLPGFDWATGFEYRHINDTDPQLGKKLHLGTELSLPFVDLRFGVNQGYMTYGLGIDLFLVRLDAAYYAEEIGAYAGQQAESRFQIGLTLSLGFDADFNLSSTSGGKNRHLKKRR